MDAPTKSATKFVNECNDRVDARIALLISSDQSGKDLDEFSKKIANKKLHLIIKIMTMVIIVLLLITYILQKYL
tara:strand:- start:5522 stop:5743 length:222 start_codon:yes stop_codon:yes gene_type:complete